jgi:hypothetical protein
MKPIGSNTRGLIPRSLTENAAYEIKLFPRHCEEPLRRSNPSSPVRRPGLLRGACHHYASAVALVGGAHSRDPLAPTGWLAMTHSNTSFHWLLYRSGSEETGRAQRNRAIRHSASAKLNSAHSAFRSSPGVRNLPRTKACDTAFVSSSF